MMLNVDGVEFAYRSEPVIEDISFELGRHDILTILGPNGAGKTTLLKCLNRILSPQKGSIYIGNTDSRNMSSREIAREIGYVPQQGETSRMTVYDMILLGRRPHFQWTASQRDYELAEDVIDRMGLSRLALRYADELSGGEFQLVQVARALVQEPGIIILDEPTNSLDVKNQHRILSAIQDVVQTHSMAAVMTVHDINLSLRYSNAYILMKDHRIYAAGGREVITPEHMYEVYEVEMDVEEFNGVPLVIPR